MFDRTTWIAIALSVVGLVGYNYYYQKTYGPYLAQQAAAQKAAKAANAASTTPAAPSATPLPVTTLTPLATATPGATPFIPELSARRESLDTSRAEYLFANNTGGIEGVTLFLHLGANLHSLYINKDSGLPIGALCDTNGFPIGGFTMTTNKKKALTTFTLAAPNGLSIIKNFTLPQTGGSPEEYIVGLDLSFKNSGATPLSLPNYSLAAGGEAPVHIKDMPTYTCFDSYQGDKMSQINVGWFLESKFLWVFTTREARDLYTQADSGVQWAAVTSQYFTTIITAPKDQPGTGVWARHYEAVSATESANKNPVYGVTGGLGIGSVTIAPGETVTRHYSIYIGPKDFYSLKKMGENQQSILDFGWFHLVSETLLWGLNQLKPLLGSYAAAIIVLTLLIKTALWPLQNKMTSSMKRMQLLAPKINELKEKYKDDQAKMTEETMKLYAQYGMNPFSQISGCLPMLIQIPIFIGFYKMLGGAIELRNSHFLWITDLSQPDTIAHFMGFPINLLPIIMAGTMLWQMAISPKSGDAAQQRIMYFMPVMFLSFAYNYASGLALYWTTQNLFSIAQLYYTRNQPIAPLVKVSATASVARKGTGGNRKR
jgi:YidC/Oxa1 family membrane protein insertase